MLEINLASLDALVRAKSLRFPKDLEGLYREAHFRDALLVNRLCVIAGSLLLASFGILDEAMFPHSYHLVWTIRFGLLVPLAILLTLVSFPKVTSGGCRVPRHC